jgi:hypothetical protein
MIPVLSQPPVTAKEMQIFLVFLKNLDSSQWYLHDKLSKYICVFEARCAWLHLTGFLSSSTFYLRNIGTNTAHVGGGGRERSVLKIVQRYAT